MSEFAKTIAVCDRSFTPEYVKAALDALPHNSRSLVEDLATYATQKAGGKRVKETDGMHGTKFGYGTLVGIVYNDPRKIRSAEDLQAALDLSPNAILEPLVNARLIVHHAGDGFVIPDAVAQTIFEVAVKNSPFANMAFRAFTGKPGWK